MSTRRTENVISRGPPALNPSARSARSARRIKTQALVSETISLKSSTVAKLLCNATGHPSTVPDLSTDYTIYRLAKIDEALRPAMTAPASAENMLLAVVGAHLSGFPLNRDLLSRGATLDLVTTTAKCYKLYALPTQGAVPKPGLQRVAEGGNSIEVEVWRMPLSLMGSFLSTVAPPLGIGSIEMIDGRWVHGFICEPIGFKNAVDITAFKGWRPYIQSLSSSGSNT
ncbi:hypothetical protein N7539_005659 [Penicillium diatomitis]|uniref:Allophanate hydrolase C-terminal domain-containing protein n=1 Tax=Penicillium diatomitis TaxID=2819901 RepID=A0A9X0BV95_9EURO|nr:uncharacterized protein N7539_005659 [Penicillium diatomitis]KAJ5485671.1 hypothetical protein N7539_005659 [Penicillium diatomitis]